MTEVIASADSLGSMSDEAFAEAFGLPADEAQAEVVETAVVPEPVEEGQGEEVLEESGEQDKSAGEADPAPETAATEAAPEKAKPLAEFKLFDSEGELEVPDVLIEYKGNGKILKEPLDKVVRRAQFGAYNESLTHERDELKAGAERHQADLRERESVIAAREQAIERLLTDDEFLLRAREEYEQANTPEVELSRLRAQLKEREERELQSAQEAKMTNYIATTLVPIYEEMQKKYEQVTPDELWGRFTRLTQGMQVRGVIPQERWGAVEKVLRDDIGPWMAQLNEERASKARVQSETTAATVRKAQEEATKARKVFGRAAKPIGGSAAPISKPKPIVSAQDAVDSILAGLSG